MRSKLRLKIFQKIAQNKPIPSDQLVNVTPNVGTPPKFTPTNRDSLIIAFNTPGAFNIIEQIANELNNALFYASNGAYNFQKGFQLGFPYTEASVPSSSKDLKLILMFSKEVYNKLYNNGLNYSKSLNRKEYLDKINALFKSSNLENLSKINPSSQLATKIGSNLKDKLKNYLNTLITLAPSK